MANNESKIAELQAILDSGATTIVVDGTTVAVEHASIRKRIQTLKAQDPNFRNRRPRAASIKLGGF